MSNLTDKEKKQLYGEIAVEFAYAKDTDSACIGVIEKIQRAFDFPLSFIEKAKQNFFYSRYADIGSEKNEKLFLTLLNSEQQTKTPPPTTKEYSTYLNRHRKNIARRYFEIKDGTYFKRHRVNVATGHRDIEQVQDEIKETISLILKGENLHSSGVLDNALDNYNECIMPQLTLNSDDTLFFESHIIEDLKKYAVRRDVFGDSDRSVLLFYAQVVRYCFIEFIRDKENRESIKSCDNCSKGYIAKTKRKQRFCSKKCRLTWHNRKRIESGEHARYKRERKEKGKATPSYWG